MAVRHVVTFGIKEGTTVGQIESLKKGLLGLPGSIPQITGHDLGFDLKLPSGQNHPAGKNRFVIWSADFASDADYEVYASHQAHVQVINDFIKPIMEPGTRAAIQYALQKERNAEEPPSKKARISRSSTAAGHKGAVIYEVNLTIDADTAKDFGAWLGPHIDEILALPGFIGADWLRREEDGEAEKGKTLWTIQYHLTSRAHLQDYFDNHAARLRGDGLKRFEGRFTAARRILHAEV
eukprot:TRINITY_DN83024_c0_g1_i1.p1 TRINITY_DN83024_c0_g1~~TRINITY_DN83024_c0_g1_i1.p1  ORF type:complete len:237 (-),score=49.16 TRINITY_DN83024_c0_g1_i1:142-852(-)